MNILYYEPLPTLGRAQRAGRICASLKRLGHSVLCYSNRYVSDRDAGLVTDCINPISAYLYLPLREGLYVAPGQAGGSDDKDRLEDLLAQIDVELVLVWNGLDPVFEQALNVFTGLDIEVNYAELSWFDQSVGFYLDKKGVNGASSLLEAELKPLDESQKTRLDVFRKQYVGTDEVIETKKEGRRTALVVLQCETDTNITLFSPFKTMREFIRYLESWIPDEWEVLIRQHPLELDRKVPLERKGFQYVDPKKSIRQAIHEVDLVIGINSTSLLESLLLQKPIAQFGMGVSSRVVRVCDSEIDFHEVLRHQPSNSLVEKFLYELIYKRQLSWHDIDQELKGRFGSLESSVESIKGVGNGSRADIKKTIRGKLFLVLQKLSFLVSMQ